MHSQRMFNLIDSLAIVHRIPLPSTTITTVVTIRRHTTCATTHYIDYSEIKYLDQSIHSSYICINPDVANHSCAVVVVQCACFKWEKCKIANESLSMRSIVRLSSFLIAISIYNQCQCKYVQNGKPIWVACFANDSDWNRMRCLCEFGLLFVSFRLALSTAAINNIIIN